MTQEPVSVHLHTLLILHKFTIQFKIPQKIAVHYVTSTKYSTYAKQTSSAVMSSDPRMK